ncbi:MAG: hypothetical protein F4158_08510 [Synechococcus sp. SB0675_bin_7]|nr:hypothetical protein [Synechococcus sp. SB0675_bin_7]
MIPGPIPGLRWSGRLFLQPLKPHPVLVAALLGLPLLAGWVPGAQVQSNTTITVTMVSASVYDVTVSSGNLANTYTGLVSRPGRR